MGNLFDGNTHQHQKRSVETELNTTEALLSIADRKQLEKLYSTTALSENGSKFDTPQNRIDNISKLCRSKTLADLIVTAKIVASFPTFVDFVANCTRINSKNTLQTIWNVIPSDRDKQRTIISILIEAYSEGDSNSATEEEIISSSNCSSTTTRAGSKEYVIESLLQFLANKSNQLIASVATDNKTINNSKLVSLSFEQFSICLDDYFPRLSVALETVIKEFCFGMEYVGNPFDRYIRPTVSAASSRSEIVSDIELLPLSFFNVQMENEWFKLYTNTVDGMSFNRIVHHILGYEGATCILIKAMDGRVFGLYSHDPWKENNRFFGSSRNFLFYLRPELAILRSKSSSNSAYQWLNTNGYGAPHGLAFGGTRERFRCFIPDTLENCVLNESCLTYEPFVSSNSAPNPPNPQTAAPTNTFEIDCMEIWACGGKDTISKGKQAQQQTRTLKDEAIQKARKVDKAQFFNNSFDQEFLLSGTLQHREQTSNR